MQCRTCGYRLWNLHSRQCPECGGHFRPSEFEFVPGAVAFCCPDCDKTYYGTSRTGHLFPESFDCVGCGHRLEMDQMVLRPAEGVDEASTEAGGIPWLNRRELGNWRALVKTTRMAMLKPTELMRHESRAGEGRAGWNFAAWSLLLTVTGSLGVFFLAEAAVILVFLGTKSIGPIEVLVGILIVSIALAFGIISYLLYILIWGWTIQGVLHVTGKGHRPLARTYRALCYSAGANAASIVPCLGWYFGWIWWLVSAVLMVKSTHRISGGRAALAVLALPGIGILSVIGIYVVFFFVGMSSATTFTTVPMMPPGGGLGAMVRQETTVLLQAYLDYATDHGELPKHPLQMMDDQPIGAAHFVASDTDTQIEDVKWASLKLSILQGMNLNKRADAIDQFVEGLPDGAFAHRTGDFVFTCPGVDPAALSPDVWLVIYSPSPDHAQTTNPFAGGFDYVGRADGTIVAIPKASFQNSLQGQMATRKANRLPALPKLSSITHHFPAVANSDDES